MKNTDKDIFNTDKTGRLLIKFMLPNLLGNLIVAAFMVTDQLFISNKVGILGNAATNVIFPIVIICASIHCIFGYGGAIMYGVELGKGNKDTAKLAVITAIKLTLYVTLITSITLWAVRKPLLYLCGATDDSYPYAEAYLLPWVLSLPFNICTTTVTRLINADGSPKVTSAIYIISMIINFILDYLAVIVLNHGIFGASVASAITNTAAFIMVSFYIKKFKLVTFNRADIIQMIAPFNINIEVLKQIIKNGLPSGIGNASFTINLVVANVSLKHYGDLSIYGADIAISSMGIVNKFGELQFALNSSVTQSMQPILAYNHGANNIKRMAKVTKQAYALILAASIATTFTFVFVTQPVLSLFGIQDKLFLEFVDFCLKSFFVLMPFLALSTIEQVYFQVTNKVTCATIIASQRPFVYAVFILILSTLLGIHGAVLADTAADSILFLTSLLLLPMLIKSLKIKTKEVPQIE